MDGTGNDKDLEGMSPAARLAWAVWAAVTLSWFFYGYLDSLSEFLGPLSQRVPFLRDLIGKGAP